MVVSLHRRAVRGFTLIELMIVVAVVAILAAIAYPSYQDAVRKSRRGQAKADLLELAQNLERYHTVNNSYGTSTSTIPGWVAQSPRTGVAYYTISVPTQTANTFVLSAAPNAAGGQNRDTCGTLTINQANVRTAGGASNPSCF
jgi:type IV pilus assembly protein PilE